MGPLPELSTGRTSTGKEKRPRKNKKDQAAAAAALAAAASTNGQIKVTGGGGPGGNPAPSADALQRMPCPAIYNGAEKTQQPAGVSVQQQQH